MYVWASMYWPGVSGSLLAMLTNYATMVNNNNTWASPGMYICMYLLYLYNTTYIKLQ